MPICALWAAASRSAWRTSGRRRNKSAGMPSATSGGAVGIGPPAEPGLQVFRRDAQQDAQRVGVLPLGDLQFGDRGLGLLQRAAGLGHVELARRCRP